MKRLFLFLAFITFSAGAFSDSAKLLPRSEVFFTQMENCYAIELAGIEPAAIQMELPELPLGTKFISSKKEEFISQNGIRGTLITLWFSFAYSGDTRIPPLLIRINGRNRYYEFEKVTVYENPNLISPKLEITFENQANLVTDKKSGKKCLYVQNGEKINFMLKIRYCLQITDFKWVIPKDSIFRELERFEFAGGTQRNTQFTNEAKDLARFEWQILKEGTYQLPQFSVGTLAFSGSKKTFSLPRDIEIIVTGEGQKSPDGASSADKAIFAAAFESPSREEVNSEKPASHIDFEKKAKSEHRSFLQKFLGRRYAIFAGGQIFPIPEEKANGQNFTGGQKVRLTEQAEEWTFIECQEFSGWTQSKNLYEIK